MTHRLRYYVGRSSFNSIFHVFPTHRTSWTEESAWWRIWCHAWAEPIWCHAGAKCLIMVSRRGWAAWLWGHNFSTKNNFSMNGKKNYDIRIWYFPRAMIPFDQRWWADAVPHLATLFSDSWYLISWYLIMFNRLKLYTFTLITVRNGEYKEFLSMCLVLWLVWSQKPLIEISLLKLWYLKVGLIMVVQGRRGSYGNRRPASRFPSRPSTPANQVSGCSLGRRWHGSWRTILPRL